MRRLSQVLVWLIFFAVNAADSYGRAQPSTPPPTVEHSGKLVVTFRLNGIVPPAFRNQPGN